MPVLNIYTDGACSGNQVKENIGGWGAILEFGSHQKELYGGESHTTNNRMEMKALLHALEALKLEGQTIRVFSDSSYLMNCFREKWHEKWKRNNWKTAGKTDVENRDLWESLLLYAAKHEISFYRVKGHLNLEHPNTDVEKWYQKFLEWNGSDFTKEDFTYITKMNHRADWLATRWIEENRQNIKAGEV